MGWAHVQGYLAVTRVPTSTFVNFALDIVIAFVGLTVLLWFLITQLQHALSKSQDAVVELSEYKATLEDRVAEPLLGRLGDFPRGHHAGAGEG